MSNDNLNFVGLGYRNDAGRKGDGADFVSALMNQCLAYHAEHEAVRQASVVPAAIIGVDDEEIAKGKARAQAVLARIQKQQALQLLHPRGEHAISIESVAEQRRIGLERESKRRHRALLKNLEYLSERDNQRIQLLEGQVAETAALEKVADQRYKIQLEDRRQRILGMTKQERNEKGNSQAKSATKPTTALYVSGLPVTEDVNEEFIQNLFGAYGSISKIHFYRNKQTGELKGDGLVVYRLGADSSDGQTLLDTVCGQLNGAELPSGSILHVEPSNTNSRESTDGMGMVAQNPELPPTTSSADDSPDELDEFFDSL